MSNAAEETVPSGYKRTEVGVIPEDWTVTIVGSVASVKTGPFGSALHEKDYIDEGIPIITVEHLGDRGILHGEIPQVSESDYRRLSNYRLAEGDIVFSRVGSVDRNAHVNTSESGWLFSGRLLRVRIQSAQVSPKFLSFHFHTEAFKQRVRDVAVGQTMASINTKILSGILAVIPSSTKEQQLIAAALSDADALIESLEQLIAKKRLVKQGTMQELLTGKRRLPGFSGSFTSTTLGACLVSMPDYGINAPACPFSEDLPRYLRITDISEFGGFQTADPVSVDSVESDKYYLQEGDLVFARTGASVGKSYLYDKTDGPLVFAGFLIRVRPDPQLLDSGFLSAVVTTNRYWTWVSMMSMRSGQPGINGVEYSQLPLSLPTTQEQSAIARILSDMDAELDALEARLAKARQVKQGMMQQLLTGKIRLV